ncbi:MAG: D-alanyl-D-alanine carboxypeptidase family protein [Solirubrobacteraceae bacterium]
MSTRFARLVRFAVGVALCLAAAALLAGALVIAPHRALAITSPRPAVAPHRALAITPARASATRRPRLNVSGAILIEQRTGQLLYGVNPGRRLPIASTTKLMTALVTLERIRRLGRMFTAPNYRSAPADSQIGLIPGERMSVSDLLLALLLPSADDAAQDLAYNVGHGSVVRFIRMMNARARELGLTHTHYSTPIGFDTPGNYSSASDLVKLASFLLRHHTFFRHAVASPRAVLRSGNYVRVVSNTNDLVGRVRWVNGVKSGHTLDAGYVLVGSGTRSGMTLLSAVLGTSSQSARDAATLAVLSYGFASFVLATPVKAGSVAARVSVRDRPGVRAEVIAASTVTRVIRRGTRLSTRIRLPNELAGPLRRHAILGTLVLLGDGRPIARVQLLLANALAAVSPLTLTARFITRPTTLVWLALAICLVLGVTARRRWRIREQRGKGPSQHDNHRHAQRSA